MTPSSPFVCGRDTSSSWVVDAIQLPMVPQLRDVKAPLMTVPPFNNKPGVLSPLSATRTFVEVRVHVVSRIAVLSKAEHRINYRMLVP